MATVAFGILAVAFLAGWLIALDAARHLRRELEHVRSRLAAEHERGWNEAINANAADLRRRLDLVRAIDATRPGHPVEAGLE